MLEMSWEKLCRWYHGSCHLETLEVGSWNLFIKHEILNLVLNHIRSFLLGIRMIEYHRCVLCSFIITLHIESGWIVKGEKESAELLITDLGGIKTKVENFNMTSGT